MTADLRKATLFFRDNAGYIVGQRLVGALHLARAESYAHEQEWSFQWTWDEFGDLGDHEHWCNDARAKRTHTHEVLTCIMRDSDGEVLAVLGGIIDPSTAYARVIEAELASEAIAESNERTRRDLEAPTYLAL